jgi:hypothetical protein
VNDTVPLRSSLAGLLSFAAAEEQKAARTLAEAIEANPDLRAHASRDPGLRILRETIP